ncbi:hypothetical protein C6P40_002333 [Pichia californica]|uniref:Uncharacterized protein n=1 Tax=Pichia californica TaxID=460514 RepID=A0A9P6WNZ1_9ASCO|nr:hypothetical protein C6P42_004896 [[Candida] californica]KAG0690582.1 hypothetical protein C6P40_002333 [[Candida] californica]
MIGQRRAIYRIGNIVGIPSVVRNRLFSFRVIQIPKCKKLSIFQKFYINQTITPLKQIRYQSTNSETDTATSFTADDLYESRLSSLELFTDKSYLNLETIEGDSDEHVLKLFESIKSYQQSIYDFNKLSPSQNIYIRRSNDLLKKILLDPKTKFDETLLKKLFITQPLFPTLESIIKSYYSKSMNNYIPSKLAFIPFRKLIWDAQFQQALDYVELTNGNKRYIEHRKSNMKRIFTYFGGSIVGLVGFLHAYVSIFHPEIINAGTGGTTYGIYGIYACIVTYIVNCGFLAGLAFSSKGLENGNLMFKQSTMPHEWYLKVDQMKMCSKIVEADSEINGIDGFATRNVVSRVQKMGFEVNEPEQEVMLRQYWYSSGEGFLWVEPDIDPAEVEWWKHLDDIGVKKVWDQDYNKIEEADASEEVEDGDNGTELYLPEDKKE